MRGPRISCSVDNNFLFFIGKRNRRERYREKERVQWEYKRISSKIDIKMVV